jgi:ubiquinone/menaquinone biosynthesis C-methylase UbiE
MIELKRSIKNLLTKTFNSFSSGENILEAKRKWNQLAKKNARYYVLTDKGEAITEAEFRDAGKKDVEVHVFGDEIVMKHLYPTVDKIAIEIGCGIGRLSEFLAPHFNKLYAVDISEEMINGAKERLPNILNTEFLSTDGESFPLSSNTIDFAFSFIVFQHMPNKEVIKKNIKEISRVLRKNGLAKVQLRGIPVSKDNWYYGPSFTKREVEKMINGIPLEILKIEGEGQKYLWVWLKKS